MTSTADLWAEAQTLEQRGGVTAAREIYERILAEEPRHVPASLRMSRLEQRADRYRASKQHAFAAASAIESAQLTRSIGYVTARLLEFAEEARVATLIAAVPTDDPHVVRQSPTLAQHLWLAGHYRETLRFLDAIAKQVSVHPLLTFTRANVLRYLGDMEGAEREYEATLRMSADFADAHWALATHSRANPPLARVPRIQAALLRSKEGSVERAHLLYALFREFDGADMLHEAWSALVRGAEIMQQRSQYSPERESERLQMLRQVAVDSVQTAHTSDATTPIFIVGMPRTGTTLLDRMLGNHPDIESLGERNDFAASVSEAADRFIASAPQLETLEAVQTLALRRAGDLYLERVGRIASGRRYVVDKNPQNLFNIPLILNALPNARILCLRRDAMDACFSNLKELFQGDAYSYSYDLTNIAHHYENATSWMRHWAAVAPTRVAIVDYEDLANAAATEITRVLAFLGVPHVAELHDITRNTAPVATASSSQVREEVHQKGIGAWKRYQRYLEPLSVRFEKQ